MKGNRRIQRSLSPAHSLPRLLLLALFFLAGVILGQVLAGRVPEETGAELNRYLEDYVRLNGQAERSAAAALSAAALVSSGGEDRLRSGRKGSPEPRPPV